MGAESPKIPGNFPENCAQQTHSRARARCSEAGIARIFARKCRESRTRDSRATSLRDFRVLVVTSHSYWLRHRYFCIPISVRDNTTQVIATDRWLWLHQRWTNWLPSLCADHTTHITSHCKRRAKTLYTHAAMSPLHFYRFLNKLPCPPDCLFLFDPVHQASSYNSQATASLLINLNYIHSVQQVRLR
jgi:hypothetical protein